MTSSPLPPSPLTTPPTKTGQIMPGLHVEWILDNQILVLTARDLSRPVIDAWVDILKESLATWNYELPYLSLYDLNFPKATLTPYMRQRIGEVLNNSQNLAGRTAIFMQPSFLINLVKLFLQGNKRGTRQRKIFHNRDEALAWLKAAMVNKS